ncbi:transglutaminase family protein [bacterium AH-315-L15]|nr:transglutaminase family protein [bacterium AH-315-L15]
MIQIINKYLFQERGFRGNTDDYFNPDNSYLNRVLDRGLGIPISLSAVYLFVSRRLDLPIVGVGMPGHFLIAYPGEGRNLFLDPFNSGQIMTRKTCVQFLKEAGYGWREDFLDVCKDREILARMIRNMIASYTSLGENKQANQLSRYLQILIS